MLNEQMDQSQEKKTDHFSTRELQILEAIESGCTNGEIAQELGLSKRTVKYHLTRIFNKFGVSGRMELARYSLRNSVARRTWLLPPNGTIVQSKVLPMCPFQ